MTKIIQTYRGSALMIALFMMATLGVVTFTMAKIYIANTKTSTNIADTQGAYFAAEGALERSLLAYQKNHDVQASGDTGCNGITDSSASCQVKEDATLLLLAQLDNAAAEQVRISYYATPTATTFCSETVSPCLAQDTDAEIFVPNSTQSFTLNWTSVAGQTPGPVRIIYIGDNGQYDHTDSIVTAASASSQLISQPAQLNGQNYIVRFRPLGFDMDKYSVTGLDSNHYVDTNTTTIDVVGFYRNTKRQLKATINRNSTSSHVGLNSIFDYTLLSQDSIE